MSLWYYICRKGYIFDIIYLCGTLFFCSSISGKVVNDCSWCFYGRLAHGELLMSTWITVRIQHFFYPECLLYCELGHFELLHFIHHVGAHYIMSSLHSYVVCKCIWFSSCDIIYGLVSYSQHQLMDVLRLIIRIAVLLWIQHLFLSMMLIINALPLQIQYLPLSILPCELPSRVYCCWHLICSALLTTQCRAEGQLAVCSVTCRSLKLYIHVLNVMWAITYEPTSLHPS